MVKSKKPMPSYRVGFLFSLALQGVSFAPNPRTCHCEEIFTCLKAAQSRVSESFFVIPHLLRNPCLAVAGTAATCCCERSEAILLFPCSTLSATPPPAPAHLSSVHLFSGLPWGLLLICKFFFILSPAILLRGFLRRYRIHAKSLRRYTYLPKGSDTSFRPSAASGEISSQSPFSTAHLSTAQLSRRPRRLSPCTPAKNPALVYIKCLPFLKIF